MNRPYLFMVPLVLATIALLWIVPESPLRNLDDPNHWGVLGFVLTLLVLVNLWMRGIRGSRTERDLFVLFLVGMPIIYLADWVRFGGDGIWLWVELAGALVYWTLAYLAVRRSPWFLAGGIAAHALWDGWHYGSSTYVPDWYVVGCVVIDLAVGLYLISWVRAWQARTPPAQG